MADEVTLRLRGTSEDLVRAVEAAKASVGGLGVSLRQLGSTAVAPNLTRDLQNLGSSMTAVGTRLVAGFTLPIVGGLAALVKNSGDFEQAFANVRKTLQASEPELAKIRTEIGLLSRTVPQTAEELAKMAALGGQFGISTAGIIDFTKTVAALDAAVDGISAEQAAEGLAQFRTATGGAEADIKGMASALVELGNKGASSEAQILDFAQRIGLVGTTVGLTQPEIMGLGATLANIGINAEAGSTAIQRTMTQMYTAVKENGDGLQAFARVAGQSATEFAQSFNDKPIIAIGSFITGLVRIKAEGGNVVGALKGLDVESQRQLATLLGLATASGNVASAQGNVAANVKLASDAYKSGDKHLKEAAEKNKTLWSQLKMLWNTLRDLTRPLGDDLVRALKGVLEAMKPVIPLVELLVEAFSAMPGAVKVGVLGAAGLAAVAPVALLVGGQMIEATASVLKMVDAFKKMREAQIATTVTGIGTGATTAATGVTALGVAFRGLMFISAIGAALGGIAWGISKVVAAWKELREEQARGGTFLDFVMKDVDVGRLRPSVPDNFKGGGASASPRRSKDINLPVDPLSMKGRDINLPVDPVRVPDGGRRGGGSAAGQAAGFSEASQRAKRYTEDLNKLGRAAFAAAQREVELGLEVKDAAAQFGMAQSSLERYIVGKKEGGKASKVAAKEERDATKDLLAYNELRRDSAAETSGVEQDSLKVRLEAIGRDFTKRREALDKNDKYYQQSLTALNTWEANARRAATGQWVADTRTAELERQQATTQSALDFRDRVDTDYKANLALYRDRQEQLAETETDSLALRLAAVRRKFQAEREGLDKTSMFYEENLRTIASMEETAAAQATREWDEHFREVQRGAATYANFFRDVADNLKGMVGDAFKGMLSRIGGGEGLGGAFRGLGADLSRGLSRVTNDMAAGLGGRAFSDLGAKLNDRLVAAFGVNMTGKIGQMLGPLGNAVGAMAGPLLDKLSESTGRAASTLGSAGSWALKGAALGSVVPGVGTAVGAAVGGVAGALKGLFGDSAGRKEENAATAQVAALEAALTKTYGSLENVRLLGKLTGVDLAEAFGGKGKQGLEALGAATQAFQAKLAEAAADFQSKLGGSMAGAAGSGRLLDESMRPYIAQLRTMGLLTDETAAKLTGMTTSNASSWQQMQSLAEKYGVSLAALGPTFQQQKLTQTATEIISAFDRLVNNGADFTGVLAGMRDEINAVVLDSLKFGTQIPENMRPWIAKLIESRDLVDANGTAITNIDSLQFGPEVKSDMDDLIATLKEMVQLMRDGLAGAVDATADGLRRQRGAWREWRDDAVANARDVEDAVNAVSLGRSPGGLKEIPLELARSEAAMRSFHDLALGALGEIEGAVNKVDSPHMKVHPAEEHEGGGKHPRGHAPDQCAAKDHASVQREVDAIMQRARVAHAPDAPGRTPSQAGAQDIHVHLHAQDGREVAHLITKTVQDDLDQRRLVIPADVVLAHGERVG